MQTDVEKAILDLILRRIEDVQGDVDDLKDDVKKLLEFKAENNGVRGDVKTLNELKARLVGASALTSILISGLFEYFLKK